MISLIPHPCTFTDFSLHIGLSHLSQTFSRLCTHQSGNDGAPCVVGISVEVHSAIFRVVKIYQVFTKSLYRLAAFLGICYHTDKRSLFCSAKSCLFFETLWCNPCVYHKHCRQRYPVCWLCLIKRFLVFFPCCRSVKFLLCFFKLFGCGMGKLLYLLLHAFPISHLVFCGFHSVLIFLFLL